MNTSRTAQMTVGQMTTGSVTSTDGTPIGYLRAGHGPAVVVLHGSNESARSHAQLALALADSFTVYLPDRRGRGLSGPHRPDHSMHQPNPSRRTTARSTPCPCARQTGDPGRAPLNPGRLPRR